MNINVTDEQIEKLVEKTVRDYVLSKFKKKIDDVMKDKYHFHQSISDEMKKAIRDIMDEKVRSAMSDKQLAVFIDTDKVSERVADRVLDEVTEKLKDAMMDAFH